jgi:phosphatidylglycerophosphatase C
MAAQGTGQDTAHPEDGKTVLAAFDFDGTITTKDSFPLFLRHSRSRSAFARDAARVLPTLCGLWTGRIPRREAKRRVLDVFFHGWTRAAIRAEAERFCAGVLPRYVRPAAMERLDEHRSLGHRVVVVTASADAWIAPWCASQGLELVATELAYDADGVFRGELATPNCRGPEKVTRLLRFAGEPRERLYVHAYGDSSGDLPLLQWADERCYKPFRMGR